MEHGEAVTYIVYVRVYVYRLIATVYIVYLSARTGRSPPRVQQPRRPAPRRLCPLSSPTARGHEMLLAVRSDQAHACPGFFVLPTFAVTDIHTR